MSTDEPLGQPGDGNPGVRAATQTVRSKAPWHLESRARADPDAFRIMSAASQMLSAEVFDEVEDLLDYER